MKFYVMGELTKEEANKLIVTNYLSLDKIELFGREFKLTVKSMDSDVPFNYYDIQFELEEIPQEYVVISNIVEYKEFMPIYLEVMSKEYLYKDNKYLIDYFEYSIHGKSDGKIYYNYSLGLKLKKEDIC
jgi:hypothetical protein